MKNLHFNLAGIIVALTLSLHMLPWNTDTPADGTDAAATDFFLKIDGVDGESSDRDHKKWIELESWQFGQSTRGGTGKKSMETINFVKQIDKSSPQLATMASNGTPIKVAILHQRCAPGSNQFMAYELKDVLVSSYQTGGSAGMPTETFSLNFEKVKTRPCPKK